MSSSETAERIQLHLVLPYKFEAIEEPRVKKLLDRGYLVEHLQRVTDREVIITLRHSPA